MKSNAEVLGNQLRIMRDQAEMQLSQMADLLERFSASQLSRIERSDRVPDGLMGEYKAAIQRYVASKADLAEFDHITSFLTIVNTPPATQNQRMGSNKMRSQVFLPEQIKELSTLEEISNMACTLLGFWDGAIPEEAMIVSLGENSFFDPGSQMDCGAELEYAVHCENWQDTLLNALFKQCKIKHIFGQNRNIKQLFARISGVAKLCRDTPLNKGKYSTFSFNEHESGLKNDILLVQRRGLLVIYSNAKGQIEGGVFFPESSQRFKQQKQDFEQAINTCVPFIDIHTLSIIQAKFSEIDQHATGDRILFKSGIYILMVPDYVSKGRMDRVLPDAGLSSQANREIEASMTDALDRRLKRFLRWRLPLEKTRALHLLSQRSIQNFIKTGELEDGLEYQIYRRLLDNDKASTNTSKGLMENIAFTDQERLKTLESIINFIEKAPEKYELFLIESFASYGLDKAKYAESNPDIWWAVSKTGCFFLFGRRMSTDEQVVMEIDDPTVNDEFQRYFTALSSQIKRGAKPVEYSRIEQLKWLKQLRDELAATILDGQLMS